MIPVYQPHVVQYLKGKGAVSISRSLVGAEAIDHTGGGKGTGAFGISRNDKRFGEGEIATFVRWLKEHVGILTATQTMRKMDIPCGITKAGHVVPVVPSCLEIAEWDMMIPGMTGCSTSEQI